jgi:hypothetical protein
MDRSPRRCPTILVNGRAYHWYGKRGVFAAQDALRPLSILVVELNRGEFARPVPGEVVGLIRQGLRAGWRSREHGPPFRLSLGEMPAQFERDPRETQWQAATNPLWLLAQLGVDPGQPPVWLAVAAGCRLVWDHLSLFCRERVTLAEDIAERQQQTDPRSVGDFFGRVREEMGMRLPGVASPVERAEMVLLIQMLLEKWTTDPRPVPEAPHGARLATLVRDIFGNPFYEPTLRRTDLNQIIRNVAEAIHAERSFADLPILGDALEEAGCTDAVLLEHLHGPGPHAWGCWALELVLGLCEEQT